MRPTLPLAILGALLLVPAAQAVEFPFGSQVGSSDYDLSPLASASGADLRYALCFIDEDGDSVLTSSDYLLLVTKVAVAGTCPARLSGNPGTALALATNGGLTAGTEVRMNSQLAGVLFEVIPAATQVPHAVRYFEDGSDPSKLDDKDTVYIDLKGTGATPPRVDVNDVRLTTFAGPNGPVVGGQFVKADDPDMNRLLTNVRAATAPATKLLSTPNMVYKAGSGFYVNADFGTIMGVAGAVVTGDVGIESGDFRLNPRAVNPLSDTAYIVPDKVELVDAKVAPGAPFQVKVIAKNTGRGAGAGLIETTIDDRLVDARGTPTIEPNGVATLVLTLIAPTTPGLHSVKSGTYADFLTVEGSPSGSADLAGLQGQLTALQTRLAELEGGPQPSSAAASTLDVPAAAPLAVLGALVALAVLARRPA